MGTRKERLGLLEAHSAERAGLLTQRTRKQLEKARAADVIIVDAPAAGHAVTFLTSAAGLLDAVRVGPIRTQAQDVIELLSDPARSQVLLVTLPEETPVNETAETAEARLSSAVIAAGRTGPS